ncbi:methyltransferase domain-containing protein [uncultured Roseobacter sp.]|uniref:methyltransferase domain-containing protein n=1 Tax=uncultured Roseobacter sp. TaxID=114847 RepID=UPI00261344C9|nr:methyltransferase domain-containing protein [uncultured Roseobacter sp.]
MAQKFDRITELRRYADKSETGIEIAPYCTPIASRREGYSTINVDVFDTATILKRAAADEFVDCAKRELIEEVDLVGDASDLAALTKKLRTDHQIGYIVSSHNFEHLPNPLKFLKDCSVVLKDGGVLSMAIPDFRACFDHFRFPTRLSDWLDAYHRPSAMPQPSRIFETRSVYAEYRDFDGSHLAFNLERLRPEKFVPVTDLKEQYSAYLERLERPFDYVDSHFSAMFGETFELMVRDLIFLGELDLEVLDVSGTKGHEFFVHLRKSTPPEEPDSLFFERRAVLLKRIQAGLGSGALPTVRAKQVLKLSDLSLSCIFDLRTLFRTVIGAERYARLRRMNADRRARRKSTG